MQNAFRESFDGKFRNKCLDQNLCHDLVDARQGVDRLAELRVFLAETPLFQRPQHQMAEFVGIDGLGDVVEGTVVSGAKPLFLLDYFASSKLDEQKSMKVVSGIVKGCIEAECSLIGGETAEMPGFYKAGEYDLAGFAVGIVEDSQLIDGSGVTVGDKLIGIASSGLHSNGYSLVRKVILGQHKMDLEKLVEAVREVLGEELLRPSRIYVKTILNLTRDFNIGGIAHITGGGIMGNLPRIIPKGCKAIVRRGTWEIPPIFSFLKEKGKIPEEEMLRTFNNGIGMVLSSDPKRLRTS